MMPVKFYNDRSLVAMAKKFETIKTETEKTEPKTVEIGQ